MKFCVQLFCLIWGVSLIPLATAGEPSNPSGAVFVISVRDEIDSSMVYVVRRGVNDAAKQNARILILDMDTNGGRGDAMEEIMTLLQNYKGETVTYVNNKAYSAGAFIAVATRHIYMAPTGVIGAAAPIMVDPSGGVQELTGTIQKKIASAAAARIRAAAQHNGYNPAIVDAMVKETDGLTIGGKEIVKKGEILTLTAAEATARYGNPAKPLLSEGIATDFNDLLRKLGNASQPLVRIEPTGAEQLAHWITLISPLLLLIGIAGLYLEFKTPGLSIFGAIGVISLAIFFFGHYVAGLSGFEEVLLFVFGLILIGIEIFLLPGHVVPGFIGALAVLISLVWAMVDKLPGVPIPSSLPEIQIPLAKVAGSMIGAALLIALLARWLPKGKGPYGGLILQTELDKSGGYSTSADYSKLLGQKGESLTSLRPSGTARFGEQIVDVITGGEYVPAKEAIVVKRVQGAQIIVQKY